MASRHARFLFDEIDSMLYEHQTNGPPYLVKECHEWGTEFPHLRCVLCSCKQRLFATLTVLYRT